MNLPCDASCHQRVVMLHIVHYAHLSHYEALVPLRSDEMAQAVREADLVAQAVRESSAAARAVGGPMEIDDMMARMHL
jgi:hypothetical protein